MDLIGYFRRSIPHFSEIAQPLYILLKWCPDKSDKRPIVCAQKHHDALDQLLQHLITPPLLLYTDFKSFILHTDVLVKGLGCVLYQEQNEQLRIHGLV